MDYVVFLLGFAFEVGIDGAADGGRSIWDSVWLVFFLDDVI